MMTGMPFFLEIILLVSFASEHPKDRWPFSGIQNTKLQQQKKSWWATGKKPIITPTEKLTNASYRHSVGTVRKDSL